MLFTQGLALTGAVDIRNKRSRTAVELIHQLVPVRFQLLAVASQAELQLITTSIKLPNLNSSQLVSTHLNSHTARPI